MEPLRQDVNHLTKENNTLHLELMRASDLRSEQDRNVKKSVRTLETEVSELSFLNKQLLNKIQDEQTRSERDRSRLESVMHLIGETVGKEIDGSCVPVMCKCSWLR